MPVQQESWSPLCPCNFLKKLSWESSPAVYAYKSVALYLCKILPSQPYIVTLAYGIKCVQL
jgi:hypothetical protein